MVLPLLATRTRCGFELAPFLRTPNPGTHRGCHGSASPSLRGVGDTTETQPSAVRTCIRASRRGIERGRCRGPGRGAAGHRKARTSGVDLAQRAREGGEVASAQCLDTRVVLAVERRDGGLASGGRSVLGAVEPDTHVVLVYRWRRRVLVRVRDRGRV